MKIEKISDNQIRCTLTRDDLTSRSIKLSELAYGTEKAKLLFQDMIQQAHNEVGFESDNSPLMIEAIPVSPDTLVLIITKVTDPEELDTRFSKFSAGEEEAAAAPKKQFSGADDILDLFQKIYEAKKKAANPEAPKQEAKAEEASTSTEPEPASVNLIQSLRFGSLDEVIRAAHGLNHYYDGSNTLYKGQDGSSYQLILHQSDCTPEAFNKICNILSEYGSLETFSPSGEAHLKEHGDILIPESALQKLAEL